jgi:hypothetical protein
LLGINPDQLAERQLNRAPLRHASKPASEYRNDPQSYKSLVDLVARARLEEFISWSHQVVNPRRMPRKL